MAGGAIIGALRVVLGADTAAFEKGIKGASQQLDKFSADLTKLGAKVGAAMVAATTALGVAVQKTLNDADKLGKAAQSIGIPVEELSRLKHAADLSGVAFDSLSTAMGRFSRNMADAASNAEGTAGRAFAAIGVSATNAAGQLRPTTDVMGDIAERFQRMEDGSGKTALAIQLFGRAGAALIPMLNQGRDGLHAMMREADELGIVIDRRTAQAAERFNDNLTRIGSAVSGVVLRISANLLPALELLAEKILTAAKNSETMKMVADSVNEVFGFLVRTGATLAHVFTSIAKEMVALKDAAVALWSGEGLGRAKEILAEAAAETERSRAALNAFSTEITNATGGWRAYVEVANTVPQAHAPIVAAANSTAEAMRALHRHSMEAMNAILNAPTETFQAKMAAAEAAVRSGAISFQRFGEVVKKIKKEDADNMHDLAAATSSALTTIFGKSKAASIASAVINTAAGITKNLAAYPQPLAGIMAAITAASGAAQIAAIKSTNLGGGGSAPSASAGGSGSADVGAMAGQTLTINGFDPTQLYRGDAIRGIVAEINNYTKNGGEVVFGR